METTDSLSIVNEVGSTTRLDHRKAIKCVCVTDTESRGYISNWVRLENGIMA